MVGDGKKDASQSLWGTVKFRMDWEETKEKLSMEEKCGGELPRSPGRTLGRSYVA